MSIDAIINGILEREGEAYTNDPNDSGHATKWGITQTTLARYRDLPVTEADVEALGRKEAFNVYEWLYVRKPGFDKLVAVSPHIAEEIIDIGVNSGPAIASLILQRLLNALNNEQLLYRDVRADGDCGPATLDALRAYLKARGSDGLVVFIRGITCMKGARYIELAETRPKDERFLFGWLRTRVGLTTGVTA